MIPSKFPSSVLKINHVERCEKICLSPVFLNGNYSPINLLFGYKTFGTLKKDAETTKKADKKKTNKFEIQLFCWCCQIDGDGF